MTGHNVMFQASGAAPITVTVSPTAISASRSGAGTVTTAAATATASGGLGGPYTYLWSIVSGDSQISPTAPSAASTAFSAFVSIGNFFQTEFECVATDSSGSGTSNTTLVDVQELT